MTAHLYVGPYLKIITNYTALISVLVEGLRSIILVSGQLRSNEYETDTFACKGDI